jgi:serine/threonine protein kinase
LDRAPGPLPPTPLELPIDSVQLPPEIVGLGRIGPASEAQLRRIFQKDEVPASEAWLVDDLTALFNVLRRPVQWSDAEASKVLAAVADAIVSHRPLDHSSLQRWVVNHPNDGDGVLDCLRLAAPDTVTIIQRLSVPGAQKVVFAASWVSSGASIVVKQPRGPLIEASRVIRSEIQAHPLSMRNDHIIETHVIQSTNHEDLLVEERVRVLSDSSRSSGRTESANLFWHILNALHFLHQRSWLHADIKPDNIGERDGRYILLDFGVCRPVSHFTGETTATGSLRTRPPELLVNDRYSADPETLLKADVWMLGATVFNFVLGRFPLFRDVDRPLGTDWGDEERNAFEQVLKTRAADQWDDLVGGPLQTIDGPLGPALTRALARDPENRASADQLLETTRNGLGPYIRYFKEQSALTPAAELRQIAQYFPGARSIPILAHGVRESLLQRLSTLATCFVDDPTERSQIEDLKQQLEIEQP